MYNEENENILQNDQDAAEKNVNTSDTETSQPEYNVHSEETASSNPQPQNAEQANPAPSQPQYHAPAQQNQNRQPSGSFNQVPPQNNGEYHYAYTPVNRAQNTASNNGQANGYTANNGYNTANSYSSSTAYNAGNTYNPSSNNYNPNGGYNNGSAYSNNAYGANAAYSSVPVTPEKPKKAKKPRRQGGMSAGAIAILLVVCILVSGAAGFGGALAAAKYASKNDEGESKLVLSVAGDNSNTASNSSDNSVIYKSVTPEENTGSVTDGTAIANVAAKAADSVVEIVTEAVQTSSYFGNYITSGAGSGVIISEDGYIITCAHVIDGATAITVTMTDGMSYDATVVGSDSVTDIGVIKINVTGLPHAIIGDSDTLVVGEDAIAIGNPLGELGGTVTNGIISALDREVEIDSQKYNVLQTNAAINPGNSGGGLFNIKGELIGVVNAKSSGSGIEGLGFAIPINDAIFVAEQLIDYGYIKGRPVLGVYVCEVLDTQDYWSLRSSENAAILNYVTEYGVYFTEYNTKIQKEGGLEFGDRIIALDGISVSTLADIKGLLNSEYKVGDTVNITVARVTDFKRGRTEMTDVEITLIENVPENNE